MTTRGKTRTAFVCNQCGDDFPKWVGRCPSCGAWDSITEFHVPKRGTAGRGKAAGDDEGPVELSSYSPDALVRHPSSLAEVDRVLGGGLVPGAFILIGGDPGIGKSTLLLQLCAQWSSEERRCLYVSGEESREQIFMRAQRLGIADPRIALLTETSVERIIAALDRYAPAIAVMDSIQTMAVDELDSAPGTVSQIRESAAMLLRFAKKSHTSLFLIGHVTKEGSLAGPRLLEHMVDTVLYFEGDAHRNCRLLRTVKNRYGPSGEIGVFAMTDRGLMEIANPSELFLFNRDNPQSGTAIVPVREGSRILIVELQALVSRTHFGMPQRVASGINPKKLALLLAVLERHGGAMLGDHDVFFNIAGGLSVSEPAVDLGIMAALLSSFRNMPLRPNLACIGECGLGGEIRPVADMKGRLRELARMGFSACITAPPPKKGDWGKDNADIRLHFCSNVSHIGETLFSDPS